MSTNKTMNKHLDKMVVYLFIILFLVSAGAMAIRIVNHVPCNDVVFTVETNELRSGELIQFKDISEGAETWKWEFGDSTELNTIREPTHTFKKAGEYKVRLVVNNRCEEIVEITVKEKRVLLDPNKYSMFTLPVTIRVGEKLKVKDESENASTWEWRFGETAGIQAKTRSAEYVYNKPGVKTVSLIVNDDIEYIIKKRITVLPKSGSNDGVRDIEEFRQDPFGDIRQRRDDSDEEEDNYLESKEVPNISDRNFQLEIILISSEKKKPQDLTKYFCGDINMTMVANEENTTFLEFCEKIKGKKIKVKSINVIRDDESNCISTFTIKYRKRGII
jgi:plastocyanin